MSFEPLGWRNLYQYVRSLPRGILLGLGGVLLLLLLTILVGSWQAKTQRIYQHDWQQYQALQSLAQTKTQTSSVLLQGDALLQTIAAQPLGKLVGQVSSVRLQGQQVRAEVQQAAANPLFAWLFQLEQQGALLSAMQLTRDSDGMLSGYVQWGSE